jgi:uncharacterized protein YjbI with pentapeptide repeats
MSGSAFSDNGYCDELFSDLEIVDEDCSGIIFEGCTFENCSFEKVSFKGGLFETCVFKTCAIVLCDMTNSTLDGVSFEDCKIVGFNFSTLNNFNTAFSCRNSRLITCSFINIDIRNSGFAGCVIDDSVFRNCNLQKADFGGVTFRFTSFHANDLRHANFKDASGFQIDPCNNKMKGAFFTALSALELVKSFEIKLV